MENEIKPDPRNFRDENGKLFMIYCPKCKLENYAPSVADGQCAWCGYKQEKQAREWWEVQDVRGDIISTHPALSREDAMEDLLRCKTLHPERSLRVVHVREVLSNGK